MLTIKVVTPASILNYAAVLEDNHLFEEAFSVYERGISIFQWPESAEVWLIYLNRFVNRYGSQKVDRSRELFENSLKECPTDRIKPMILLYADFEEKYGLHSDMMQVFERFIPKLSLNDKFQVLLVYLRKTLKIYGLLRARSVFERAIEVAYESVVESSGYILVCRLCMFYARVEKNIGEIERSRAIFQHGSQFADPEKTDFYWKEWYQLELEHGNTTSFKEMLRIKRSAKRQFGRDQPVHFVPAPAADANNEPAAEEEELEAKAKKQKIAEDDELEIDVELQNVPTSVFGSLS